MIDNTFRDIFVINIDEVDKSLSRLRDRCDDFYNCMAYMGMEGMEVKEDKEDKGCGEGVY